MRKGGLAKDVNEMAQVNIKDGYVAMQDGTIGICNMMDRTGVGVEVTRDNIIDIRAMLWDVIRKQERGFDISIDDVLKIEEVRSKGRYSVSGYAEEIEWTIALLQHHLERIAGWQDAPEADREMYGKLDEFLSQFEEM